MPERCAARPPARTAHELFDELSGKAVSAELGGSSSPWCDVAALEDVLLGLSALAQANQEIAELDTSPVAASANPRREGTRA